MKDYAFFSITNLQGKLVGRCVMADGSGHVTLTDRPGEVFLITPKAQGDDWPEEEMRERVRRED